MMMIKKKLLQLIAVQVSKMRSGGDSREDYYSRPSAGTKQLVSFKIVKTTGTPDLTAISVFENRSFSFVKVDVKSILLIREEEFNSATAHC